MQNKTLVKDKPPLTARLVSKLFTTSFAELVVFAALSIITTYGVIALFADAAVKQGVGY